MAIVDRRSLPLAVHVACASPHEVRLVDATLEDRFIAPYPPRLIGDRAYDSDRLDAALWTSFGIELIAPHRDDCVRPTQDGRALRRSGAGSSNGSLPGCTTRGGSSRAVSGTSRTSWPCLQLGCMRILLNRL